jgi:hypothetical protein
MGLFLVVRAGDGISWPVGLGGRTRECLLGNRATLSSPESLAFP